MSVTNLSSCVRGNCNVVELAASGGLYQVDCTGKFGKIEFVVGGSGVTFPITQKFAILEGASTEYDGLLNDAFSSVGYNKDTASKINFYWESSTNKFCVQNKLAYDVKLLVSGFLCDR